MELDDYVRALLDGDDEACAEEARRRISDVEDLRKFYVDTIQPSQYRIGEMWERGEVSVAAEHLATATNSFVAASAYAFMARSTRGGPKAFVACTTDELHELGPRLLADVLETDGWDVDFYGASMPLEDLIAAIRERRPLFVGLSVALKKNLAGVERTIAAIRESLGPETPPIVVGGNAFRDDDEAWRRVGADMYAADAVVALEMLRGLRGE